MSNAGPVLSVRSLTAGFGRKDVLHNVDLCVEPAEILLVLGHNGAGKTTLLNTIFGMLCASAGTVEFASQDITARPPAKNVAAGLALVPQGHGVFRTLSVKRNLELATVAIRRPRAEIGKDLDYVYRLFPILATRSDQLAGTMSGGQQQMLSIGMALMHRPRVLLLDEPSIGLSPKLVKTVIESVRHIRDSFGSSIVLVEQNIAASLAVADRVAILRQGRKIYDGSPAPLENRAHLLTYF